MENGQRRAKSSSRGRQITNSVLIAACLLMLLAFGSCTKEGSGDDKKVKELESKVVELQKKVDDLQLKGQIVTGQLARINIDRSFYTAAFWNQVYDSGQADCARSCIAALNLERDACAQKPTDELKTQCYIAATDRAATCQQRCTSH